MEKSEAFISNMLLYPLVAVCCNVFTLWWIWQWLGSITVRLVRLLLSINYGAGKTDRVMETRKYAIATSLAFGVIFTAVLFLIPNTIVGFFMKPTEVVLTIAPAIMRAYGISFILMPFNMFSTYYFQSVAQARVSLAVSLGRGLVLSGILIFLLPVLFGNSALWFTMPIAELAVAGFSLLYMKRGLLNS